ncbi:MAG: UDP-N-acetylglucosamine 4,6-dehydratase (inverting) [Alphaproteobacteria bacterium]|nr:UDP-N-acetylglucosamine 4,6-dehydratase (inverting) [Alphaproteobacteria bacterium]
MALAASPTRSAPDARHAWTLGELEQIFATRDFAAPWVDLNDKVVMVTGGTGSFGNEFVRLVSERYRPRKLIVFSRDELKQYEMAQRFPAERFPFMRYFIGDVRNRDRLELAMRGVDYVIHAAAMKQVPTAEYNPFECIHTNVLGAENIVTAAIRTNVKRVVALSTDKAANPINLYGASKLASDKIFVAGNNLAGADGPRFCVVRYGNVAGSRGSVIPFFLKLAQEGATSIPITDERMTRFWITLKQGVDFVLSSLALMRGGEIFVPKIPSTRIVEIADLVAPGLEQRVVGIRPGEKLHEVMVPLDDGRTTLELSDRYVITPTFVGWSREPYLANGARTVGDGFSYASDSNPERLDARALQSLLEKSFS